MTLKELLPQQVSSQPSKELLDKTAQLVAANKAAAQRILLQALASQKVAEPSSSLTVKRIWI